MSGFELPRILVRQVDGHDEAARPAHPHARCCSARTFIRTTSWRRGANPGWSSIRSATLAIQPTTRFSTCSTIPSVSGPTLSASLRGWPTCSISMPAAYDCGSSLAVCRNPSTIPACNRWPTISPVSFGCADCAFPRSSQHAGSRPVRGGVTPSLLANISLNRYDWDIPKGWLGTSNEQPRRAGWRNLLGRESGVRPIVERLGVHRLIRASAVRSCRGRRGGPPTAARQLARSHRPRSRSPG